METICAETIDDLIQVQKKSCTFYYLFYLVFGEDEKRVDLVT